MALKESACPVERRATCMFSILKVEALLTKGSDGEPYDTEMLTALSYRPCPRYLSGIDWHYWWNANRSMALTFATREEADAAVTAYRVHQKDRRSRITIIED
jgi:hypothetical protein